MNLNLPTVILIFMTSCLCILGLIGVVLLFTVSAKYGRKRSERIVSELRRFAKDNPGPLPVATRLLAGIYVLISLSTLGALLFLVVIILANQAGFPLTNNLNVESLGFISAVILLVAMLATLILRILFAKIFKSR
jgi:hypothetical protein